MANCGEQATSKVKIPEHSILPPEFCDLEVELHGITYQMHRSLATQESMFFEEKILQGGAKAVLKLRLNELRDMPLWLFEHIFRYIESKEIVFQLDKMDDILSAAARLKMAGLTDKCDAYLSSQFENEVNMGAIYEHSIKAGKKYLAMKALGFMARHFSQVSQTANFLNYLPTTLESILLHNRLSVISEMDKPEAVISWLNFDWPHRCIFAVQLFHLLDFCAIPEIELVKWCLKPTTQLVLSNDACLRKVHVGLVHHMKKLSPIQAKEKLDS